MSFRTTLILLIVALGLGIYIGVYERATLVESANENETGGKVLAAFDRANVGRIVIESDGKTTELHKHAIYWIFDTPISDRASAQAVDNVLDQLSHLNIQDELRPQELLNSTELSDSAIGFGDDNRIRVSLYPLAADSETGEESAQKDKEAAEDAPIAVILLGNPAPLSNTLYARIEGDSERAAQTYVVSGSPRQYLSSPVAALRDRALLGVPAEQITAVVVRTASGEVEVTRDPARPQAGWSLTRPLETRADTAMMEDFLNRLNGLQIAEVVEEKATSSTLPTQIPSGSARVDLTVYGWDQPLSLYLSPEPGSEPAASVAVAESDDQEADAGDDEVSVEKPSVASDDTGMATGAARIHARVSTRPGIYLLQSGLLASIPDTPAEFRDPYLARIPPQYLHSITIISITDPNVVLTSEGTERGVSWYSARNGIKDRANLERLKRMLNAINGGRVLDFLTAEPGDLGKYGLDKPEMRIAFNFLAPGDNGEGTAAAENAGKGQQRILQFARTDENTLFANFLGEPWVYQVDPAIRSAIPSHPLKWRDLKVLNFNLIGLKRIQRNRQGSPPLELNYNYAIDEWSGEEAGADISSRIDKTRAMALARTLGSLTASDWITNLQTAYQGLETPSLELSVTRREIDPLTKEMMAKTDKLRFTKAPVGGYYGNLVGTPDVFLLDQNTYRDLVAPVVTP